MQEAGSLFSGSGMESKLVGINTQLDRAVKSLKEIDRLSKSASGSLGKVSGSGGVGSGSGSVMPTFGQNMSAAYSAGGMGVAAGAMTALGGIGKAAFGMAGGLMAAMPDTTQTINYASQYYNASLFQRRGVNRQMMQKATFGAMSGGMTSVGSDAAVAEYLSGSGMVFSGAKNSTYMQTVRGVSNAAKYMNMENGAAARAIEGMTSGSMSKNMMMNFGIMTSDQKTGKALTQGQIFEQLSSRLTAGRGAASEADVLESYRRGNLGATLKASGLSEDQQQMFVQYMVEKSRGNNMDLSDQASMDKLMKDSKSNKGLNPQGAGMEIKSSDTKLMNAAVETYIKAQQDMVPLIKSTNDALEALVPTVGYVNAAFQTLQGSRGTAGVIQGVVAGLEGLSQALSGVISMLAGLAGMAGIKGVLGAVGKGGGGITSSGPTSSARTPASGKPRVAGQPKPGSAAAAAKTGSKAGTTAMKALKVAGKAGGIVGAAVTVASIGYESYLYQNNVDGYKDEQDSYWNNYTQNLSNTIKSGGTIGPGYVPQGPSKKGGGYGNWGGDAGVNSFNATAPNTNKKIKFIKPADGPITSPFGNRGVDYGDGGFHNGMDIGAKEGSPIVASADGVVSEVSSQTMGGKYVKIKHANGYTTGYFHQSRQAAVSGATVKQGAVIGYVGATGTAVTGPHLHFTVQNESGKFIDPASVLSGSYSVSSSGTPASDKSSSSSSAGVTGPSTSFVSVDQISDMRAKKASQSIPGMSGKSSSSLANLLIPSSSAKSDAASVASSRTKGMYLPGAPRAKQGDPYVAQDGPVNVHAGEAILTAEQADEWRNSRKGVGGKSGKNNVTINVTVASASESEARRFAKIVKDYLEEDKMISNMGRL